MVFEKINFKKIFRSFSEEWIALDPLTNKVAASGKSVKAALNRAWKKGVVHPVVVRVPKEHKTNIF